ncbi:aspartate/methionine/tyrosine aminotransferase [Tamaricihabitans halophyticus]|uniref:Aminotransferase n=1 Tax=Tamaricihabitans halophyticus TaxID=1262583 RepID=A0A4R2QYA9_9PSEU|nr:pyridoxal phosphate-dependent aminotransferase [Tamaricihabitans halophyticus]TCP54169.1 aspartate/methionine/tyrosine aminotransferase [Tamaricihabitans halophyticus]
MVDVHTTDVLPGPAARAQIPPFHVMDVLSAAQARQASHGDMISLAAGQPAQGAPTPVREAAQRAVWEQSLGYTVQLGIPELREAIAGHYAREYALDVHPDEVIVTTGSSGGFLLAFLGAFSPGDRVALARPGYPAYRNILTALGCTVVELPCGPDTRFQPTVAQLDELVATDGPIAGLIVASPANPTGTVLAPGELAAISGWCAARGVQLISDEIYHGIAFSGGQQSAWQSNREALVINSFSKYFGMTGWRLGWMLVPRRLHRAVDCLTGNFNICAPAIAQHAAIAAFSQEARAELDEHVQRYRVNRDLLLGGLRELGFDKLAPADGAFYAWADISHLGEDSMSFCQRLLADTGVAIVPGIDFDPQEGPHYVRLSFAGATEDVRAALRRLGAWLPARGRP